MWMPRDNTWRPCIKPSRHSSPFRNPRTTAPFSKPASPSFAPHMSVILSFLARHNIRYIPPETSRLNNFFLKQRPQSRRQQFRQLWQVFDFSPMSKQTPHVKLRRVVVQNRDRKEGRVHELNGDSTTEVDDREGERDGKRRKGRFGPVYQQMCVNAESNVVFQFECQLCTLFKDDERTVRRESWKCLKVSNSQRWCS